MSTRRLRAAFFFVLVVHLQACVTWTTSPHDPRTTIEREKPARVMIVRENGSALLVERPRIRNDSILTVSERCLTSVAAGGRRICEATSTPVLALHEASGIEVERTDRLASLAMGALVVTGLFALLMVAICAEADDVSIGSPCG